MAKSTLFWRFGITLVQYRDILEFGICFFCLLSQARLGRAEEETNKCSRTFPTEIPSLVSTPLCT